MKELTDLEICQRIAEIEGVEFRIQNAKVLPDNPAEAITGKLTDVYNPLTDDALCFMLMVKHELSIINISEGFFMVQCKMIIVDTSDSVNINKAICLAIIKSKEEV
jgi:selenocysteine-specific translation elongation factor